MYIDIDVNVPVSWLRPHALRRAELDCEECELVEPRCSDHDKAAVGVVVGEHDGPRADLGYDPDEVAAGEAESILLPCLFHDGVVMAIHSRSRTSSSVVGQVLLGTQPTWPVLQY